MLFICLCIAIHLFLGLLLGVFDQQGANPNCQLARHWLGWLAPESKQLLSLMFLDLVMCYTKSCTCTRISGFATRHPSTKSQRKSFPVNEYSAFQLSFTLRPSLLWFRHCFRDRSRQHPLRPFQLNSYVYSHCFNDIQVSMALCDGDGDAAVDDPRDDCCGRAVPARLCRVL